MAKKKTNMEAEVVGADNSIVEINNRAFNGELALSKGATAALFWVLATANIELTDEGDIADYVSLRNGKDERYWTEIDEFRKKLEKFAKAIKGSLEHCFDVGDHCDNPKNVNWSKQSYTPKWSAEGAGVAVIKNLVEKGMITVDEVLCEVSVDALVRASGIEKNKLIMMYPEAIVEEPKKKTLSIK